LTQFIQFIALVALLAVLSGAGFAIVNYLIQQKIKAYNEDVARNTLDDWSEPKWR